MSSSSDGWFKLTSTLPWASGWLKASSVCAPLGSLSPALGGLLLTIGSSSLELRWITSVERLEKVSKSCRIGPVPVREAGLRSADGKNTDEITHHPIFSKESAVSTKRGRLPRSL